MTRWLPWLAVFLVGLALGYLIPHKPQVIERLKIQEREVVKWRTQLSVRTLPGATVFVSPEGSITLTGPIELTQSATGERERERTEERRQSPAVPYRVFVAASAIVPRETWQFSAGTRIGHLLFLDVGVFGTVETHGLSGLSLGRFGGGFIISF
mgnify:FL=1